MTAAVLQIRNLSVSYRTRHGRARVLRNLDAEIREGEVLGLVGESGSGKSTLAFAIMRHLTGNAEIEADAVLLDGEDLLRRSAADLGRLRGNRLTMVYQDPNTALNPTLRIGEQITELLRRHLDLDDAAARRRAQDWLTRVALTDPDLALAKFPHEMSGGEKQRVLIAMAFACSPRLVLFDEPTTALDATTAANLLDLFAELQAETGVAALYITHDLGIVSRVATNLAVLYGGTVVEQGPVHPVFRRPRHPYTAALLASLPSSDLERAGRKLITCEGPPPDYLAASLGCVFQDRCGFVTEPCRRESVPLEGDGDGRRTACLRWREISGAADPGEDQVAPTADHAGDRLLAVEGLSLRYGRTRLLGRLLGRDARVVRAVTDISFEIARGETVGLVGESGCGKSSLARALAGLRPFSGTVDLGGRRYAADAPFDRDYRQAVQIVFQHPDTSLNPRQRVLEILSRPLKLARGLSGSALEAEARAMLERVRLPRDTLERFPHELSGGEKQRVAIARAFLARPSLIICDEITSSLDVSVQASIVNQLVDLQRELGTAFLFITHDINLVRRLADRILVMYLGRIVEERQAGSLLHGPYHPYTEALLSALPTLDERYQARRVVLDGAPASRTTDLAGCVFEGRCPRRLGEACSAVSPPDREPGEGHRLACHIPLEDLITIPPIWRRIENDKEAEAP